MVGIHRQRRVAILHVADELHDVPAVGRDAVALHRDLRAPAAETDVAAGEVVGPRGCLVHRALAVDVVDLEGAALGLAMGFGAGWARAAADGLGGAGLAGRTRVGAGLGVGTWA